MFEHLRTANHLLERKVEQSTRELIALNEEVRGILDEMQALTTTDEQTELYNRRAMLDRLEYSFKQSRRYKHALACLSIILTEFNDWLDVHDFDDTNALLREIAHRLHRHIRDVDSACRANVDEFTLILPHTNGEQAMILAQRLLHQLADIPYTLPSGEFSLHFAIGIADLQPAFMKSSILLQHAREMAVKAIIFQEVPPILIYSDPEHDSL